MHSNNRAKILTLLRSYFQWLYENRHIAIDPYLIIKQSDIPKKIKNLPQPLDPETDKELINYLQN